MIRRGCSFLLLVLLPLVLGCGSGGVGDEPLDIAPKIVDGTPVEAGELPAVRRLYGLLAGIIPVFKCTGTFITPRHYLTAAHCVVDAAERAERPELLAVEYSDGEIAQAVKVSIFPGYTGVPIGSAEVPNRQLIAFDLAVVEIGVDFPGTPALLATTPPTPGEPLLIAGYGRTFAEDPLQRELRSGVITVDEITQGEGVFFWRRELEESNTCYGDSGGPTFAGLASGVLTLVGVTSSGSPDCAAVGSFSSNTLTTYPPFLQFISEAIAG